MVLIGLLLVAVVTLILGFVYSSFSLFIVSLVASALAAVVLLTVALRQRSASTSSDPASSGPTSSDSDGDTVLKKSRADKQTRAEKKAAAADGAPAETETKGGDAASTQAAPADSEVVVVDGKPDYHRSSCSTLSGADTVAVPLSQALEDGFAACSVCSPPTSIADAAQTGQRSSVTSSPAASEAPASGQPLSTVWVVDGAPEFHAEGCRTLSGREAEAIPANQAVEDGFTACEVCSPVVADSAPVAASESSTPASSGDVWVADGHPEYHVQGCSELEGLDSEPVPHDQAVEDGFQPCVVCNPESAKAAAGTPSTPSGAADAASVDEVWVVDGLPEYHRSGCDRLQGQDGIAIPREQAVEDGFEACSLCSPNSAESSAATSDDTSSTSAEPAADEPESAARAASAEVLVVDGFPAYHRQGCRLLLNQDALAIPHDQAVEDGFEACDVCTPDAAGAPDSAFTPLGGPDVWVVDGRPDYHRAECTVIVGLDSEPVPHDQAVEDGFSECTVCTPESATAPELPDAPDAGHTSDAKDTSDAGETSDSAQTSAVSDTPSAGTEDSLPADVWVVDGYPDYHRPECSVIVGLNSEPVPHDQAVEDGFSECTVCTPEAASAPAAADTPEPEGNSAAAEESGTSESSSEPAAAVAEAPPAPAVEEPHTAQPAAEEPVVEKPVAADEPKATPAAATTSSSAGPSGGVTAGRTVWVIEGRPRFHTQDCLIIKGQQATEMSVDEAGSEGYKPCSLCRAG